MKSIKQVSFDFHISIGMYKFYIVSYKQNTYFNDGLWQQSVLLVFYDSVYLILQIKF